MGITYTWIHSSGYSKVNICKMITNSSMKIIDPSSQKHPVPRSLPYILTFSIIYSSKFVFPMIPWEMSVIRTCVSKPIFEARFCAISTLWIIVIHLGIFFHKAAIKYSKLKQQNHVIIKLSIFPIKTFNCLFLSFVID